MGKLKADGLDPIWDFKTKNMLLALYLKFLIPTDLTLFLWFCRLELLIY